MSMNMNMDVDVDMQTAVGKGAPGQAAAATGGDQLASYPLLRALIERRSRRFARGMRLNGGPLAFQSQYPPQPLSLEEEAALAFAACGITGPVLGDLPYQSGDVPDAGGGNIMTHFVGRTVGSGDAIHSTTVFVTNDEGTWMLRRPQDYPRAEIADLAAAARRHELVPLYERSRVRIADRRTEVARVGIAVPSFNKWSANVPGTTYFVPVAELTALYINILLAAFSDEMRCFILDERNLFRPAGVGRWARSRGGLLHDDPADERIGTVWSTETWLYEFTALEQGQMLQNLALMVEALGLGGFAHFAAHPWLWCQALGFRMQPVPFARTIGAGRALTALLRAMRRDQAIPTAIGLEQAGVPILKPYCPPYYRTMEEAVLAFVETKYAEGTGSFRDGGAATAWQDPAAVQAGIPRYSDQAIEATIAYCEYVYRRYGRFPAYSGPFRTVLAYQAHHLDPDFYARFYRPSGQEAPAAHFASDGQGRQEGQVAHGDE